MTIGDLEASFASNSLVDADSLTNIWDDNNEDKSSEIQSAVNSALGASINQGSCPFTDTAIPYGQSLNGSSLCGAFSLLQSIVKAVAYIFAAITLLNALVRT